MSDLEIALIRDEEDEEDERPLCGCRIAYEDDPDYQRFLMFPMILCLFILTTAGYVWPLLWTTAEYVDRSMYICPAQFMGVLTLTLIVIIGFLECYFWLTSKCRRIGYILLAITWCTIFSLDVLALNGMSKKEPELRSFGTFCIVNNTSA